MNLIEQITSEILEDNELTDEQSRLLVEAYRNSQDRQSIDDCFICLCGYRLSSFIN